MKNGDRVQIKCSDGSGYLQGEIKGIRFGKFLVFLDEFNTIPFEFEKERLELISEHSQPEP